MERLRARVSQSFSVSLLPCFPDPPTPTRQFTKHFSSTEIAWQWHPTSLRCRQSTLSIGVCYVPSRFRILEWLVVPSSRGSSHPRDRTCSLTSPALAGGFFTTSFTWEARTQACLQTKAEIRQLSFLILNKELKNNNRKRLKMIFLNWRSLSLSHTHPHTESVWYSSFSSFYHWKYFDTRKCKSPQFSSMCCTGQCKLELHTSAGAKCFCPFRKKVNIKTF